MRRTNTHAGTVRQVCNHSAGQLLTSGLICVPVIAASCLEQKSYPPHRHTYRISLTWEAEASNWSTCTEQIQTAHVEKLKVWYLYLILFQRGELKAASLSLCLGPTLTQSFCLLAFKHSEHSIIPVGLIYFTICSAFALSYCWKRMLC